MSKNIYIRTVIRVGSSIVGRDGALVGVQAIRKNGHCQSFSDVWRQSIPRPGRTHCESNFPPGKIKTWLIYVVDMMCPQKVPAATASKNSSTDKFRLP